MPARPFDNGAVNPYGNSRYLWGPAGPATHFAIPPSSQDTNNYWQGIELFHDHRLVPSRTVPRSEKKYLPALLHGSDNPVNDLFPRSVTKDHDLTGKQAW